MANYVAQLQPELDVNYCRLVVVWTDDPASTRAARQEWGAHFPFLCDHERKVIAELDIVDTSDASHPRIAIPYTFVLDAHVRRRRVVVPPVPPPRHQRAQVPSAAPRPSGGPHTTSRCKS
ncbi:MAG: redoxin domain-containing protein [Planctomycetes bacterium]|nr:redoxin domain-containing protein [Planctomycetota bacterium]